VAEFITQPLPRMKLPSTWYARATLRSVSSGRRVAIFDAVYEVPEALLRFSFKDKSHPFEKASESELEEHSVAFLKSNAAWFARHHLKSLPDNFHVEFDDTLHEHAFPLGGKKEKPTAVSASGVKIWLKGERYLE
jgi:hypothetical protein